MAIRRTKKQKEHAAIIRQQALTYQFEDKIDKVEVKKVTLDQKQLKKLISSDPKMIVADLVRTMITTIIILLLLLVIYFWLK